MCAFCSWREAARRSRRRSGSVPFGFRISVSFACVSIFCAASAFHGLFHAVCETRHRAVGENWETQETPSTRPVRAMCLLFLHWLFTAKDEKGRGGEGSQGGKWGNFQGRISGCGVPVFNVQAGDAGEFADVVRYERGAEGEGVGGDQHISLTDGVGVALLPEKIF